MKIDYSGAIGLMAQLIAENPDGAHSDEYINALYALKESRAENKKTAQAAGTAQSGIAKDSISKYHICRTLSRGDHVIVIGGYAWLYRTGIVKAIDGPKDAPVRVGLDGCPRDFCFKAQYLAINDGLEVSMF